MQIGLVLKERIRMVEYGMEIRYGRMDRMAWCLIDR